MSLRLFSLLVSIFVTPLTTGCPAESPIPREINAVLDFYGKVVDEDGNPLPNARVTFVVDAYPSDWTFETRGRAYERSEVTGVSDSEGRVTLPIVGCIIRLKKVDLQGFAHFYERDLSGNFSSVAFIRLISGGEQQYRSLPDNPAIFVLIPKDGREVSVLPGRGGATLIGKKWIRNQTAWPNDPSITGIRHTKTRTLGDS